jgi:hypothetical protein
MSQSAAYAVAIRGDVATPLTGTSDDLRVPTIRGINRVIFSAYTAVNFNVPPHTNIAVFLTYSNSIINFMLF